MYVIFPILLLTNYFVLLLQLSSFIMTYVGVKCQTRHCSLLRDTLTRGTT